MCQKTGAEWNIEKCLNGNRSLLALERSKNKEYERQPAGGEKYGLVQQDRIEKEYKKQTSGSSLTLGSLI